MNCALFILVSTATIEYEFSNALTDVTNEETTAAVLDDSQNRVTVSEDLNTLGESSDEDTGDSGLINDVADGSLDSEDDGVLDDQEAHWIGQEYGVIVALPPRLSEPSIDDANDWMPTSDAYLPAENVQEEAIADEWEPKVAPDFSEVIKKAKQNIYPLPEPLLAKALAMNDDTTSEAVRRLQTDFKKVRERALLADAESRRLSDLSPQEQKVFIYKLLQDNTPASNETGLSEASTNLSEDSAGSTSLDIGSADLEDTQQEADDIEEEASHTSSHSNATAAAPVVKPTKSPSASKETTSPTERTTAALVSDSKKAIEQVNAVLSNINQVLGGVSTSTMSPPVAIAQGVQHFISGLNLLAIELAKESS